MQMVACIGRAPLKQHPEELGEGQGWGAPSWQGQKLPGLSPSPSPAAAFRTAAVRSRSSRVGCSLPSTPVNCTEISF